MLWCAPPKTTTIFFVAPKPFGDIITNRPSKRQTNQQKIMRVHREIALSNKRNIINQQIRHEASLGNPTSKESLETQKDGQYLKDVEESKGLIQVYYITRGGGDRVGRDKWWRCRNLHRYADWDNVMK